MTPLRRISEILFYRGEILRDPLKPFVVARSAIGNFEAAKGNCIEQFTGLIATDVEPISGGLVNRA